jgi:fungalysin/thermolysin propeptide
MTNKLAVGAAGLACAMAAGIGGAASAARPERTPAEALAAARAPRSELAPTRTVDYRGFRVERFQQRIDGYPVIGGDVTVVAAPDQPVRVAADATAGIPPKVDLAATGPRLSRRRAVAIAKAAGGVRAIRPGDRPSARLAVDRRHGGVLVWQVELPSARPLRDLEVLVDARSGEVRSQTDLLQRATGKARLYVPNPIAEQGSYKGIGTTPKADRHDRSTHRLARLRRPVTLPDLSSSRPCLIGKYVEVRLDANAHLVCRISRNWHRVTRSDDRFEALMAYYHIDRTQRYIQSLGFTPASNNAIDDRRQRVIADAFAADNSFYSCQDRQLRYGSGGIDDAEDGDVIVHEYGHSIENSQGFPCTGSTYSQAGALAEGWGDYVSAMMTLITPGLPHPTRPAFCIFDWDGTAGYNPRAAPCGRVADGSDGVHTLSQAVAAGGPCDFGGRGLKLLDSHCVGEIWTHGLIDLRLALGSKIDRDLLASQFSYVDNERFREALDALVAADTAVYGGADVAAICNEMVVNRGITGATRCP